MTRPPLYSRTGNASSPTESGAKMVIGPTSPRFDNGGNSTPNEPLLEKAKQFSMFALHHVEEVRQALIRTAETPPLMGNESVNEFGGKNGTEIAAAFEDLTAAYDKLSSLKWDAARKDFEDDHREKAELDTKYSKAPIGSKTNGKIEKRVKMMSVADTRGSIMESRGVKDHPWQDDDDMNPHDWIADAFLKSMEEEEDEVGDSFPENGGNLASLNATAEPFPAAALSAKTAATPPGFKSGGQSPLNDEEEDVHVDSSAHTKQNMQGFTSISSEISSLRTSSLPCTDDDDSHYDHDLDSDYSDTSSSSEELPSMENFDYLYKGGYAMQVSGGKETKGVVPKTVKHVLVDRSVKSIEEGAFQGCNVLESITIPSSVEAVGDNSFRKCSKLKSVTFLTKIPKPRMRKPLWNQELDEKKEEKKSFRRSASAPSSMTEPSSSRIRSIGEWAFFNCSSLAAVQLPYGLESIGARAFQRCSSMSITGLPKTLMS
ncbi:hypothetical protein ACHAXR_002571, partial [Thalassiosira sp. AJA248-18]